MHAGISSDGATCDSWILFNRKCLSHYSSATMFYSPRMSFWSNVLLDCIRMGSLCPPRIHYTKSTALCLFNHHLMYAYSWTTCFFMVFHQDTLFDNIWVRLVVIMVYGWCFNEIFLFLSLAQFDLCLHPLHARLPTVHKEQRSATFSCFKVSGEEQSSAPIVPGHCPITDLKTGRSSFEMWHECPCYTRGKVDQWRYRNHREREMRR